jgi:hypothetical protein
MARFTVTAPRVQNKSGEKGLVTHDEAPMLKGAKTLVM